MDKNIETAKRMRVVADQIESGYYGLDRDALVIIADAENRNHSLVLEHCPWKRREGAAATLTLLALATATATAGLVEPPAAG